MVHYFVWWLFWLSVIILVYTYIGFPMVTVLRGLLMPKPIKRNANAPTVSFIVAVYNEANTITHKLDNLLSLDYPPSQLEVIVVSDGSDDGTNELVAHYNSRQVRLLALPRQGKNRALNAAVATAEGEILVFSDADSMLNRDALRYLMAPFSDPQVGCVGGDYRYTADNPETIGERSYWSFDRALKGFQSLAGSMSSVSGALKAVRHSLFVPVPSGVTDDFFIAAQVISVHQRVIFEPRAVAYGPIADSIQAEFRRKVRVITRGLQGVWTCRRLLNPLEYGFFSLQLLSHKVLRRVMVIPLIVLVLMALMLWTESWLYQLATVIQLSLHGAALLGWLLHKTQFGRFKVLRLSFFFDMVNFAALIALVGFLRGVKRDVWVPQRSMEEAGGA